MKEERTNIPAESTYDTILIVDDDEINRAILENIFSSQYKVAEADNGRLGLEKILRNKEQLCAVLLDVVMPEMDGLQVLRRLNEEGIPAQIPISSSRQRHVMSPCGKPMSWGSWTSSANRSSPMW